VPDSWVKQLPHRDGYWSMIRQVEERLVRGALEDAGGNKTEAARILGVQRSLPYDKMRALGLG
jgi:DNA-binding NtrC family response regulator